MVQWLIYFYECVCKIQSEFKENYSTGNSTSLIRDFPLFIFFHYYVNLNSLVMTHECKLMLFI